MQSKYKQISGQRGESAKMANTIRVEGWTMDDERWMVVGIYGVMVVYDTWLVRTIGLL